MKNIVFSSAIFVLVLTVVTGNPQHQADTKSVEKTENEIKRVVVDVYYESLCPDSIAFFTKQLYPSLQGNLSQFVNLTLVPYGKSNTSHDPTTHETIFQCHHGPGECRGNKIQACALNLIDPDKLGYNKRAFGFINCLMDRVVRDGNNTKFPTSECATINPIQNVTDIETCAQQPKGTEYLRKLGEKTHALKPELTSVPTIVFNGEYKKSDNDLSQNNFVKALCQYIDNSRQPHECLKNTGNAANQITTFTVTMILAASVFLASRVF